MSIKIRKVVHCDVCGTEDVFINTYVGRTCPKGWERKGGKDLCPACYNEYCVVKQMKRNKND